MNYCYHESKATTRHLANRSASPREAADITLRLMQGSRITASTNPCDHAHLAHLAHGMSPVAMGSGGPSGLEDSPVKPSRAKQATRKVPRSRVFCAVLRWASQLETAATIPRCIRRGNYCYHKSQLALQLNR